MLSLPSPPPQILNRHLQIACTVATHSAKHTTSIIVKMCNHESAHFWHRREWMKNAWHQHLLYLEQLYEVVVAADTTLVHTYVPITTRNVAEDCARPRVHVCDVAIDSLYRYISHISCMLYRASSYNCTTLSPYTTNVKLSKVVGGLSPALAYWRGVTAFAANFPSPRADLLAPVSYTHLTLPTIYSV